MFKPYLKVILVVVVFVGLGAAVAYFQYNKAQNAQIPKLNTESNVSLESTTTLPATSSKVVLSSETAATTSVNTKATTTVPVTNESTGDTKLYTNKGLHFSVRYPSILKPDQYSNDSVDFSYNSESDYFVMVTSTAFKSTKDWLSFQPNKPSAQGDGYELVSWVDSGRTAIVARYIVTELDEKQQPIYAKQVEAYHVENGKLYTIGYGNYFQLNQTVSVDPEAMAFITSFQVVK